jgi:hypothetical protein
LVSWRLSSSSSFRRVRDSSYAEAIVDEGGKKIQVEG